MKSIFRCFVIVFALLNLIGCAKKLTEATLPIGIKPGSIYFTQVSLQYEKDRHLTTNYRKGTLIPVNTQVQLQEITSDDILLEILPSHTKFRIENVEKHTGDSTTQAFSKLFAKNKVDLTRFSNSEQENILAGKVTEGMQKKAVITAIGYPPITETPNLQSNQWTYWSSRFNRFIVCFDNDRISKIQD